MSKLLNLLKWTFFLLVVFVLYDPPELIVSTYDSGWESIQKINGEYVYSGKISLSAAETIPEGETVRITYSRGGESSGRNFLLSYRVIVDGVCVSACASLFILNDNACYTNKAVFKFHARHYPDPYISVPKWIFGRSSKLAWRLRDRNVLKTREFVKAIREPLRGYLQELPDTSRVITPPQGLVQSTYPERKC